MAWGTRGKAAIAGASLVTLFSLAGCEQKTSVRVDKNQAVCEREVEKQHGGPPVFCGSVLGFTLIDCTPQTGGTQKIFGGVFFDHIVTVPSPAELEKRGGEGSSPEEILAAKQEINNLCREGGATTPFPGVK